MATYDPDADPADFDPTDPEMVDGYLNDPANDEVLDILARDFRNSPPADQVETIGQIMAGQMRLRDRMARTLDGAQLVGEARDLTSKLLDAKREEIRRMAAKIVALSEQTGPAVDEE